MAANPARDGSDHSSAAVRAPESRRNDRIEPRRAPTGTLPIDNPTHLEVARHALVVGRVEDETDAFVPQIGESAQRQRVEDALCLANRGA